MTDILRKAKKEQHKNRFQYGKLYQRNYYREVLEKNRVHYEYYHLDGTEDIPEDYKEIFFVCLREDGCLELPVTVESLPHCKKKSAGIRGLPLPHTEAHLHDESPVQRDAAERCAGTLRTLGCQYHNECLRPRHKGSKAQLCKALGSGSGNELTIKTEYKKLSLVICS